MSADVASAAAIDPFGRVVDGVYRDARIEVRAHRGPIGRRVLHAVRTPHFDVRQVGARLEVVHRVPAERVDDDLSGLLADELFHPGWLRGPELFERVFTGVVLSSAPDPLAAWSRFYRNTIDRVEQVLERPAAEASGRVATAHGTIAGYAPVYAIAERLLVDGSALELGCCFGFLSLRLATSGRRVTATDISPGTVGLLAAVASGLGVTLETCVADAARVPRPSRAVDNVLAVHLLEHVDADHGTRILAESIRLARRRVVVAVPLEDQADETWGHVRTVSLEDLDAWGAATGLAYEVREDHGGWLVLDVA